MRTSGTKAMPTGIEFLRQRNNRHLKRERKKRVLKMNGFYSALIIALLISIGSAVYAFGVFIFRWEKLNIDSYKLINPPVNHYDQVREILRDFRGNLLAVNLESLRAALQEIRSVRDVAISRNLPDSIHIRFLLRQPAFQGPAGEGFLVLSREGIVLDETDRPVEGPIPLKNIRDWSPDRLEYLYGQLQDLQDRIEYVDHHPVYGTAVKLKGLDPVIYPGEANLSARIAFFLRIRDQVMEDPRAVIRVDLRIPNRIYLEYGEKEPRP